MWQLLSFVSCDYYRQCKLITNCRFAIGMVLLAKFSIKMMPLSVNIRTILMFIYTFIYCSLCQFFHHIDRQKPTPGLQKSKPRCHTNFHTLYYYSHKIQTKPMSRSRILTTVNKQLSLSTNNMQGSYKTFNTVYQDLPQKMAIF